MSEERVVLGLGSNVGDRRGKLELAVAALSRVLSAMRVSPVMETPALLPPGAPPEWDVPFLNMAVSGAVSYSPQELLAVTQALERELGRQVRGHWGPREIDIDILAYGTRAVQEPALVLPHPHVQAREFARVPFQQVEPELYARLFG